MLILCDECKNHYDDSSQTAKCKGVGRSAGGTTSHAHLSTSPIEEHVANTRAARRARVSGATRDGRNRTA